MESGSIFIFFVGVIVTLGVSGGGDGARTSNENGNATGEDNNDALHRRHHHQIALVDPNPAPAQDGNRNGPARYQGPLSRALAFGAAGYSLGAAWDVGNIASGSETALGQTGAVLGFTFSLVRSIVHQIMQRYAQNPPNEPSLVEAVIQALRGRNVQLPENAEELITNFVHQMRQTDNAAG